MREAMEPLFYAAGVDIALLGHLHAYEVRHVTQCSSLSVAIQQVIAMELCSTTAVCGVKLQMLGLRVLVWQPHSATGWACQL